MNISWSVEAEISYDAELTDEQVAAVKEKFCPTRYSPWDRDVVVFLLEEFPEIKETAMRTGEDEAEVLVEATVLE